MRNFLGMIAIALTCAGCMSSGVKVTEDQMGQLKVGETTYADAIRILGQPSTNTFSSDGTRITVYAYTQVTSRPESFIPIVGPLVGGADAKSNSVVLTFDKNSKLVRYSGSGTAIGAGHNLESGVLPERIEVKN